MNINAIFTEQFGFKSFSQEHIFIVIASIGIGLGAIRFGRRSTAEQATQLGKAIGWTVLGFEVVWLMHKWLNGTFNTKENLPLDLCNICALVIPLVMMRRHEWLFQIMYYWVLTFTLQGLLTPELKWVFPYIGYLKYWAVHVGLVLAVLYALWAYRWRPTLRGLVLSFAAIQIWAGSIYILNSLSGSNYGYLMQKPDAASIFDYFGEHYILVSQGLALCLFFLLWLPFGRNSGNNTEGGN